MIILFLTDIITSTLLGMISLKIVRSSGYTYLTLPISKWTVIECQHNLVYVIHHYFYYFTFENTWYRFSGNCSPILVPTPILLLWIRIFLRIFKSSFLLFLIKKKILSQFFHLHFLHQKSSLKFNQEIITTSKNTSPNSIVDPWKNLSRAGSSKHYANYYLILCYNCNA